MDNRAKIFYCPKLIRYYSETVPEVEDPGAGLTMMLDNGEARHREQRLRHATAAGTASPSPDLSRADISKVAMQQCNLDIRHNSLFPVFSGTVIVYW